MLKISKQSFPQSALKAIQSVDGLKGAWWSDDVGKQNPDVQLDQKKLKLSNHYADNFHVKTIDKIVASIKFQLNFLIFRGRNLKRGKMMEAEDFFREISEFEFICDDIGEIKDRLNLTKSEDQKISQAITSLIKARKILTELFPNIKSLDSDVREDLEAEFADFC